MTLQAARKHLAELASEATGIEVDPFFAERISPPRGFVIPGDPYLSPGNTFGSFLGRWEVTLVTRGKVSETGSELIDDLIEDAVVAIVNGGYDVVTVAEPFVVTLNGAQQLAVTITCTKNIAL